MDCTPHLATLLCTLLWNPRFSQKCSLIYKQVSIQASIQACCISENYHENHGFHSKVHSMVVKCGVKSIVEVPYSAALPAPYTHIASSTCGVSTEGCTDFNFLPIIFV